MYLIALSLAACGGTSSSQYVATLSGASEVPATTSTATGDATFTVSGTKVTYTVNFTGLTGNPSASHIHVGSATVKGGVVVTIPGLPALTSGTYSGSFTAANVVAGASGSTTIHDGNLDDLNTAIQTGNAYFNIHTAANPGGEIRGQLHSK